MIYFSFSFYDVHDLTGEPMLYIGSVEGINSDDAKLRVLEVYELEEDIEVIIGDPVWHGTMDGEDFVNPILN